MDSYEVLLKRGLKRVPEKEKSDERFRMPEFRVQKSGSRSLIVNFAEAAKMLNREPGHLMKFILKELATSGELKGVSLEVTGVFSNEAANRKLEKYVEMYVKCPECGKHDTELVKERGFTFIKCEVCGAREPVGKV